jgi:hypothetical protein
VDKLDIGPQEKRDKHCKVYVEPTVYNAIQNFQYQNGHVSFSEAARDLLVRALEAS